MSTSPVRLLFLLLLGTSATANAQSLQQIEEYEARIEAQQQQLDQMRRELDELKAMHAEQQKPSEEPFVVAADPEREMPGPFVLRKNENLSLLLSGRVHRMVLGLDDGANTDRFFTDSEQGPTSIRFDVNAKASEQFSVGATIETGIRQNRPFLVSQDNPDPGTDVTVRIAEVTLNHSNVGKFSIGRGFSSAWLAPEMDLSGTQFASLLPVGMLAPGMKFVDRSDDTLSDIQVLNYFVDVERLLLVDRIRYDSPGFGMGMQVSGTIASDGRWDASFRMKPKATEDWTFVAGASFQHEPFAGIDQRIDAVGSVRHNDTGLNFTAGFVTEEVTEGGTANTYVLKAGWLADFFDLGKTAFSLDYYDVSDLRLAGDAAKSYGFFAVQKWPAYGIDFYGGYRMYDVDRPDIDLHSLDLIALGITLGF